MNLIPYNVLHFRSFNTWSSRSCYWWGILHWKHQPFPSIAMLSWSVERSWNAPWIISYKNKFQSVWFSNPLFLFRPEMTSRRETHPILSSEPNHPEVFLRACTRPIASTWYFLPTLKGDSNDCVPIIDQLGKKRSTLWLKMSIWLRKLNLHPIPSCCRCPWPKSIGRRVVD